ncbi:MAG TPA: helix-turn-helix domain-containing protein [Candidatus Tectomicrobia bacterium]
MASGRHSALTIQLTAHERQTLERWQRSSTIHATRARRGRMLLLLAAQVPVAHIATIVGCTRHSIYKWAQRFLAEGLAGLADKRRGAASAAPQRALRKGSV